MNLSLKQHRSESIGKSGHSNLTSSAPNRTTKLCDSQGLFLYEMFSLAVETIKNDFLANTATQRVPFFLPSGCGQTI